MCRMHNPNYAAFVCRRGLQVWIRIRHIHSSRLLLRKTCVANRKLCFSPQALKKSVGVINGISCTKSIFVPFRHVSNVQNHYEILGLGKNASGEDIRAAFLKKSKECHPDLNSSNPENHRQFVQVNEAYSILSKPQARKHYDSALNHNASPSGSPPNYSDFYGHPKHTSQEEWLRHNGLKEEYFRHTSHQQYHGNIGGSNSSNIYIVASCLVFMLAGIVFHIIAVKQSSEKHIQQLNDRDMRTHELWMNAKEAAKELSPHELTQHFKGKKDGH